MVILNDRQGLEWHVTIVLQHLIRVGACPSGSNSAQLIVAVRYGSTQAGDVLTIL
jgi:hypothetical protein